MAGVLHLIPTPISSGPFPLPEYLKEVFRSVPYIISERERTTIRFLASFLTPEELSRKHFARFDEHSTEEDLDPLLHPIVQGMEGALVSEAGLPCVADPGASLVALAHRRGISVVPHPGPSAIVQALMASGLNGQRFMFEGYLPIKEPDRLTRLRYLEGLSRREALSVGWIETPYRTDQLAAYLVSHLEETTRLCIARDIMGTDERIEMKTIGEWRKHPLRFGKIPAIFWMQG